MSDVIARIRFYEAALNAAFEEAAQERMEIELQGGSTPSWAKYRIPGDEWRDSGLPEVETVRLQIVIRKQL